MNTNRIFSILGARKHLVAAGLQDMGGAVEEGSAATSVGSFALVAIPVWPVLMAADGMNLPQPTPDWQIQQQTFQQALEQARALLSPPRHERLIAASRN